MEASIGAYCPSKSSVELGNLSSAAWWISLSNSWCDILYITHFQVEVISCQHWSSLLTPLFLLSLLPNKTFSSLSIVGQFLINRTLNYWNWASGSIFSSPNRSAHVNKAQFVVFNWLQLFCQMVKISRLDGEINPLVVLSLIRFAQTNTDKKNIPVNPPWHAEPHWSTFVNTVWSKMEPLVPWFKWVLKRRQKKHYPVSNKS